MDNSALTNRTFPSFGQAVLLVLAVIGIQMSYGIGFGMVYAALRIAGIDIGTSLVAQPLFLALTNTVGFGLPLVFGVLYQKARFSQVLPLRRPRPPLLVLAIAVTIMGAVVLSSEVDNFTRMFFPPPDWVVNMFGQIGDTRAYPIQSGFLLVVVAPVTEELFFRGLILRGLLSRYSSSCAVLLTALLFTVIHLNPWQFFSAMLLGTLLGWWFVRTKNLTVCLVGHAFANGLVFVQPFIPFEVQGFNTDPASSTPGQFQPLWFDAIGLLLFLGGLLIFQLACRRNTKTDTLVLT
ncbi:MAG TPA: type II CAAX endopeptidase family protein [Verrucomicrobiota bacterium]|nr:type II CAAX endopeptidase family protein [Verrucomicrobiota bacterium]